jgi:murein DD-endopeptidase MepM/ murein hydrolase activator NlpD
MIKRVFFLLGALTAACMQPAAADAIALIPEHLPLIPSLSSYDDIFSQYCADVENNYMRIASGKGASKQFYAYKPTKNDTLFTIAAACSIPYETIATVNGISGIDETFTGKTLILPTTPGIFVCGTPESSIEILVERKYSSAIENSSKEWYTIQGRLFYFLLNERFSSTERAFFLDATLRMPLDNAVLTSGYGMRVSPISGNWKFHKGIDLAAPIGTPVYACKDGKVVCCIRGDPTFGNYIILRHDNGMTSVYAHLSKILIHDGDMVQKGAGIGLVGKTGAATGPHLHFEIRINGISKDPEKMLPD